MGLTVFVNSYEQTQKQQICRLLFLDWDSNPCPSNAGCYCILLIFVALISSEDTNCLENAFKMNLTHKLTDCCLDVCDSSWAASTD